MPAVGIKIHFSLHYIKGFILKTSGSLSFGKVDQFRKGQMGLFSFGISSYSDYLHKMKGRQTEVWWPFLSAGRSKLACFRSDSAKAGTERPQTGIRQLSFSPASERKRPGCGYWEIIAIFVVSYGLTRTIK